MKIKYEKEVKDCSECPLLGEVSDSCLIDNLEICFNMTDSGSMGAYPCELRPCPIEVKE
jgi:hypothetical protein